MPYCRKCGSELPENANFCPVCGTSVPSGVKPTEIHRVLKVSGKPKVIVTNAAPGHVEVQSGQEGEVKIDVYLRVAEGIDCDISRDGDTISATCRTRFGVWTWPRYIFGGGPKADVRVSVPKETDLHVESRLNKIAVVGVKGALEVESSVGRVNMRDCEGVIRARTKTGSIELENVNGTVSALNSTGSIRFSGVLSNEENWFRTQTGNINLSLEGDPDLTVEAYTRLGRISCMPGLGEAYYRRGEYRGQIGNGAGKLIAETKTGNIRIHR